MLRQLTFLALFITLVSCGDSAPQPEATVTAETAPASEVATAPEVPTMSNEQAAEAKPEVIPATKLVPAETISKAPVSSPSKPIKPTQKETKPAVQAPPTPPAPKAPVSAPASAPANETSVPTPPVTATLAEEPAAAPAPPAVAPKPDHTVFNTLLGKYVNGTGNVNYAAFKKDEAKLDAYIEELSSNSPESDWSRKESMAFWINAYNANTLKLILKNHPVKSITDLHGGKPWDVKWINIGGKTYSLNNIEHDIIRPRYKDARIHFAVNCAAASCPPLPNKAFTATNLNSLLESRTKSFVRNSSYNTISAESIKVSKIFDWYGEDFGDLRKYLNKYASTEIPAATTIGFEEYNWALNKQ